MAGVDWGGRVAIIRGFPLKSRSRHHVIYQTWAIRRKSFDQGVGPSLPAKTTNSQIDDVNVKENITLDSS